MSEPDDNQNLPSARLRARHWFSWIWIIPVVAAAVVIWLAARTLLDRGPSITIVFSDAEGLQAGQTKIQHKNVDLGTVESISLTRDFAHVVVRARMRRSVTPHLAADTRFWIVRPRVGFEGISGLSTLVSGAYIEMYPGNGESQRDFVGLDEPPTLTPDTPGRAFTLHAADLGSLVAGSPISYRGVPVGEVEGFALNQGSQQIEIYAFVRAPYERLVHAETRFWNSGGVDVSIGAQGVRFRASSWQQLLSGGVSFDTPDSALKGTDSTAGSAFRLYANEEDSLRDARGPTLTYRIDFEGAAGDIGPGSGVELLGTEVGEVTDSHLYYDDAADRLLTRVTIRIDPTRIDILHRRTSSSGDALDPVTAMRERLNKLVARGLRAQLTTASFLTGTKVVSLDMIRNAPRASIRQVDGMAQLPSVSSTDISDILANVKSVLHNLDTATQGPELGHAVQELDRTLSNLDKVTQDIGPQLQPLINSLRDAAQSAQKTLEDAQGVFGNGSSTGADLSRMLRELTDAARSLRALADYLDRHPEAVLRGRKAGSP